MEVRLNCKLKQLVARFVSFGDYFDFLEGSGAEVGKGGAEMGDDV